ncbi:hypothetical protein JTE90_009935 [Oedothorax gibbosus]|uniref:Armadillo segment polarity protein n=1 Tax=Oedothorax gibbosus TaxID=931172 RepID=A0AAV6UJC5_9ARAC|nr:hypothetical protein JTE90_009935 [Oedothorax gibbosus]
MSYMMNSPTSPVSRPPSRGAFHNLPDMANPKEQTLLWQQNSYMSDSGIQSAESTHAPPTLCGKEDDLEDPLGFDWDPSVFDQSFSQDQVDNMQLQLSVPPQQPVFPDPLDQDMDAGQQFDLPQPTAGQQVAEPLPQQAINLDYQDDVDLATRLIPGLVSLLQDVDQVVVGRATDMVQQLLRREVSQRAVVRSPQLVAALVRVCEGSACIETVKCATGVLHYLSHNPEGLQNIYEAQGIPALIKALASPPILFYAITTLHNLLLHQKGAKLAVCQAGGLHMMVSLLKHNNVKFLAIVTDCLRILAYGNQENKVRDSLVILQSGGSAELVRIMRSYSYEKLLWTTSRVIKVLSVCSSNKPAIVEVGGMQALAMHLGTHSQRLVHNCLWALRNLSDAATHESNIDGLLQGLVQLLGSSDVHVVTCSAGILSNMTCNNVRNKLTVCRAGGVEAVVRAIMQAGDREEITEPAVCALRHLTSRHPEAELAQNTVRLSYGIQVIVKLLHPPSSLPLIKAVIGLIRNLALCSGNNAPLREHGAIPRLVQLLIEGYQASTQGTPPNGGNNLEEVRMEKILEGVLGALQVLARDAHNQAIIRRFNVMPLFDQLLGCDVEVVRRLAAEVLWAFAEEGNDPSSELSTPPLMELLSPPNEAAESCAAASLYCMPENKADDKKQFTIEPALFSGDSGLWSNLSPDIDMSLLGSEDGFQGSDIHMMGADEAYNEHMYNQGPPPHNGYGQQGFDPLQGYEQEF